MVETLSMGQHTVGAIGVMLIVWYLMGSILLGRLRSPLTSIAVKLGLGSLFFISAVAVLHGGLNTGMVFFLFLFLAMSLNNRCKPDFSDLSEIKWWKLLGIAALFF